MRKGEGEIQTRVQVLDWMDGHRGLDEIDDGMNTLYCTFARGIYTATAILSRESKSKSRLSTSSIHPLLSKQQTP